MGFRVSIASELEFIGGANILGGAPRSIFINNPIGHIFKAELDLFGRGDGAGDITLDAKVGGKLARHDDRHCARHVDLDELARTNERLCLVYRARSRGSYCQLLRQRCTGFCLQPGIVELGAIKLHFSFERGIEGKSYVVVYAEVAGKIERLRLGLRKIGGGYHRNIYRNEVS